MSKLERLWQAWQEWRERRRTNRLIRAAVYLHIHRKHGGSFTTCQKEDCPMVMDLLRGRV